MSTQSLELYQKPQSAVEIRSQVNLIQEVMKSVMKENTHFGTIPGCAKPSLYKAGSETLLSTFRIAIEPIVEDLSTEDVARYRVVTRATSANGVYLGSGVGEASSEEEKYKWREAICSEEFEVIPENRRREKYKKSTRNPGYFIVQQVRTEKADVANTVLKMAKKRSQIDVTLTVTAASDIFAQDIEDLPEEYRAEMVDAEKTELPAKIEKKAEAPKEQQAYEPRPEPQRPAVKPIQSPRPSAVRVISEPQRRRFYAIWKSAGRTQEEVRNYLMATFGTDDDHSIPAADYEKACAWAEGR